MKRTTNLSAKGLLILFSLLASSLLAPPEFTECQDLFPDEYIDLSAIFKGSHKQSPFSAVATLTTAPWSLNHSWNCYPVQEVFSPQSLHAENSLTTLMRC